jgi:hypothetical protein
MRIDFSFGLWRERDMPAALARGDPSSGRRYGSTTPTPTRRASTDRGHLQPLGKAAQSNNNGEIDGIFSHCGKRQSGGARSRLIVPAIGQEAEACRMLIPLLRDVHFSWKVVRE